MIKKYVKDYILTYKRDIVVIASLILIGIMLGSILYTFLSNETKQIMISSVKEVFEISKSETYVKTNIILNGMKADIILISIFCLLSVCLFGSYIMYSFMILKGIAISFYTILLFNIFGTLWGTCVVALLVILVNIIYLPALIYLVINLLEVNFSIFKARLNSSNISGLCKIMLIVIIAFVIMSSSIMVEQVASAIVLKIYNSI